MTVSTEVNQAAYTGNGVTTVFPYTFRILNSANLTVTRIDLLENETVLTLGTDYSVTGAGSYNGGSVVLPQALPNGYSLVIERDLPMVQETDLRNQGTFFAEVHEDAFDYLTMIIQQVAGWFGLTLRRPTIKSKFYDAKQYRIANLADPINQQDAVNNRTMVSYVEKMIAGVIGGFGWFIQAGVGAIYRTFQDKMRDAVSPKDFGAVGDGVADDSAAVVLADAACELRGIPLQGNGLKYAIGADITLKSGDVRDFIFIPASGYIGGAPVFICNQSTGLLRLHNIQASGFTGRGCVAQRGSYTGTPSIVFSGVCKFNNNGGGPTRTTTTAPVNTGSDYVISVNNSSVFSVNDYVWIGDSKCRVLTVDNANQITLYNNGSAPTLYSGGTGTGSYTSGQYVTKDADGKNGFTINSVNSAGWDIKFIDRPQFNSNAWFGLFQYTNSYGGNVHGGGEAIGNGYIGIGLGYVLGGEVFGCLATDNGNNGIDVFQCNGNLSIHDNVSSNNGVDGIFSGATDTAPKLTNNTCSNNKRIGILNYGRTIAPAGNVTANNICLNNGLYNINNTGIYGSVIDSNTMGGAQNGIRVEGRNGLLNPQSTVISKNQFVTASSNQDIYANVGGYSSGGDSGAIKILDNNYFGRAPVVFSSGFSTSRSKFIPRGRVGYTDSLTAVAGSAINVSLNFAKMSNTTLVDPTAGLVEMQFSNSSSFLATATPDIATRTAGVEVENTATTNGKVLAMAAAGALSYNITSTTARTLYLMFKSEYGDGVITLTWS
jgi:hypothetical protein